MADDLGFEFFKAGRDHLEAATKWQLIVAAILIYLHFGIVAPFGVKSLEKDGFDADVTARKGEQTAIAPATQKAREFADQVKGSAAQVAMNLRGNLIERFQLISGLVIGLQGMSPADAAGEAGRRLFDPPIPPQQVQQQYQPYTGPVLRAMPEALRGSLAAGAGGGEQAMTGDFVDYIRGEVIQPAFEQANLALQQGELPLIAQRAEETKGAIAAAKAKAPKSGTELDALAASVDALLKLVQQFRFEQPANDEWWRSTIGKEQSIAAMMTGIAGGVRATVKSMFTLEDLKKKADDAIGAEKAAVAKLKGDIAALEASSDKLQAQMGELAGPLKLLSFKLASLAPLLPMIIAVALAACALWRAYGLRRMVEAVSLPKAGEQIDNMRTWLRISVGGTSGGLILRQAVMLLVVLAWIWLAFGATRVLQPVILTHWHVVIAAMVVGAGARLWLCFWNSRALAAGM